MQKYVSCSDPWVRVYLYNFYGSIFNDPSVIVDETSYLQFKELMETEVDYCAKKGLHSMTAIYSDENFGEAYAILEDAFGTLGIALEIITDGDGYPDQVIFTLPSGEQRILKAQEVFFYGGAIYVRSRLGVTDAYFEQMRSYYELENIERLDLEMEGCNVAGDGSRWTYDADTSTLEITGEGSLVDVIVWGYIGMPAETISTVIVGAGISSFGDEALGFSNNHVTIVTLHGEADELTVGGSLFGSFKSERVVVLYTDNATLKNIVAESTSYSQYIEVHSLSEWGGGA
jgi:hypothetical protein